LWSEDVGDKGMMCGSQWILLSLYFLLSLSANGETKSKSIYEFILGNNEQCKPFPHFLRIVRTLFNLWLVPPGNLNLFQGGEIEKVRGK